MDGRPLSLALFSDSALPVLNGVSISIDVLIQGLRDRGHSVHLFTSSYPGHKEQDPNTHRFFALRTFFAKDYPISAPPFYPMLFEFRKHRFDLIHTHTPFTVGFVGMRWAESHGIPLVSTYHTHYDKYAHYLKPFPHRLIRYKTAKHTNFYYNKADHVITPSETSARWLSRHHVHRPMTVIPTGIPLPEPLDREQARRELGARDGQKIWLYVGRIAHEKNIGQLLRAAANAFDRDPSVVLWLVGDGPAREEYRRLTSDLGMGDRVRFFGEKPRREVDKYYAAADLFTFPSHSETQGLVVVEAMAHGLPAVVVKGGGASAAVVNDVNGLIVPNDSQQFADACLRLQSDAENITLMRLAAKETAQGYSIPVMIDKIVGVYRSVLDQPVREGALVV